MATRKDDGQQLQSLLIRLELALLSWHLSEICWRVLNFITTTTDMRV
jgi:hypothetical protein